MSKSGSRYGRRSNWFKIHCLLQEQQQHQTQKNGHSTTINSSSSPSGGNSNGGGGGGGAAGADSAGARNGVSGQGLFVDAGMDKHMAKYLEHFGTNMNAFRIRHNHNNNNNNNNCESKYNFYESDKRSEYAKRSSCSKSDDESSHSSSIVVDEDSQPQMSPALDVSEPIAPLTHHLSHHHHPPHDPFSGRESNRFHRSRKSTTTFSSLRSSMRPPRA